MAKKTETVIKPVRVAVLCDCTNIDGSRLKAGSVVDLPPHCYEALLKVGMVTDNPDQIAYNEANPA